MNAKTVLSTLSLFYIVLEAQAWAFTSRIYTHHLTTSELSQFERFGYASAGIGIALLFLRFAYLGQTHWAGKFTALLLTPLIYIMSVWGMYEAVHRSAEWIPQSHRTLAMQASLHTLAKPDWYNASLFYFNVTPKEPMQNTITAAMKRYPMSDKEIQQAYIQGMRNLALFADYYQRSAEVLDRELWPSVWRAAQAQAINEVTPKLDRYQAQHYLDKTLDDFRYGATRTFDWLPLSIKLHNMLDADPVLASYVLAELPLSSTHNIAINADQYRQMRNEAAAWKTLGRGFHEWPALQFEFNREAQFQQAYSKSVLEKYAYLPGQVIPWYQPNVMPLKTKAYLTAAEQVVPFLFKDGAPVLTFDKVYDLDTRSRYINTLQLTLPPLLKENWLNYQSKSYFELSVSPEAWLKPTLMAMNLPLLRIGAVLPAMLLLSSILLLINIATSWRQHWVAAIAAIGIGATLYLDAAPWLSQTLLKTLLYISTKESKIFLS